MNQHQEHDLAIAFNKGSLEGFEGIYKLLYHPLYLFAKTFVPAEDAADIVADTFVKIWRIHERFHSFPDIRAFLYITARNACFNWLKHQKMKEEKHQLLAKLSDEEEKLVARTEIEAELINMVRLEIDQLPPREAKVFSLAFLDGYKNEEIAQILQISYQTVSNLKTIALKKVRSAIKNIHPSIAVLFILVVHYLLLS